MPRTSLDCTGRKRSGRKGRQECAARSLERVVCPFCYCKHLNAASSSIGKHRAALQPATTYLVRCRGKRIGQLGEV